MCWCTSMKKVGCTSASSVKYQSGALVLVNWGQIEVMPPNIVKVYPIKWPHHVCWNAILKEFKYQLFFQKEPLRELNFIHNSTVVKQPFNGNTLAWFCTPLRINAFILRLTLFSDILALQADKSPFNWINPHLACSLCEGASLSIISSLPLVISLGVFGQQIHKSIMVLSFMPWFTQLIPPGLQRSLKRVGRR